MIPSCDHVGVPGFVGFTHFTSSTTSGSACLMSLRILLKVSPRQSPSSAILLSIRSDADWPSLESDSFMFSSREFLVCTRLLPRPCHRGQREFLRFDARLFRVGWCCAVRVSRNNAVHVAR